MGMEPFVQADDNAFGHLIGSIPDPVKNLREALAFKVGLQSRQAEAQRLQADAQDTFEKLNRAQMFQRDAAAVGSNPNANAISSLITKYPEFADQLKAGWDVKDKAAKESDLTQLGETYSAAASGNWSLAAKQARSRYDADKAAGQADPGDEQFLQSIDAAAAGDENARKVVLTQLGTHIAAVAGPDHFASIYGALKGGYTLEAGATRYDENGNITAESPYVKGADGAVYERDGHGGTAATPPAPADTTPGGEGGFDNAVAFTLKHEGGYAAHDMNGAPVNFGINQGANPDVDVASLTRDQATQIYKTKYWDKSGAANLPANMQTPYFDTYIINPSRAQQFLKQSGGDPQKFMQLRQAWMGSIAAKNPKYAKAYATRNADLRLQMQQGGSAAPAGGTQTASADAPPGYHVLIPGKGKEAPTGFRYNGDKLEPIPGGPADTSADSLDPQTVNFYAQQVLAGTPMSQLSFGMGKAAASNRRQVMEAVAKQAGAEGLSGRDQAIQLAHYKAGVANVTNLEKQFGTVQGNERTFEQNMQQVIARSQELPAQTGSRLLNSPIQTYLRQTNDPTVAALDVAIKTAANEYARLVTASPSGAGTLSDSARTEYQNIIQGNFPLKQKLAALKQMQVDGNNRVRSLHTTLQEAYQHLTDRAPELKGGGVAAIPRGAKVVGSYQGKRVIQLANGKRMVEQ